MSESNNVKFIEDNGKWIWKCYDEQGSVTYRSPEFDTEAQAREDYEVKKDQSLASSALQGEGSKDLNPSEAGVGTATAEENTSAESSSADQQASL